MTPTVADVIGVMEREAAPLDLAEKWDHPGLCVGHGAWPASRVWVALDPLAHVVDEAIAAGAGMLITHHPLLFQGIHGVDLATPTGKIIGRAIENRLAVFCAHTNLDKARGGTNDILVRRLSLGQCIPLGGMGTESETGPWLACVGSLGQKWEFFKLAGFIKKQLGAARVRAAGPKGLMVEKIALCAGSGGSLLPDFLASDAQVLVTGDLKYHDARTATEHGRGVIDMGHFASEHLVVEALAGRLSGLLEKKGMKAEVVPYLGETDPFEWI